MQQLGGLQRRGSIRLLRALGSPGTIFFAGNGYGSRCLALEAADNDLEERLQRVRELARARFAERSGGKEDELGGKEHSDGQTNRPKIVKYGEQKAKRGRGKENVERSEASEVSEKTKAREAVQRGPIDAKKYVEWGKDKLKLPLRDSSGLLLSKAARDRIANAAAAKAAAQAAAEASALKDKKAGKKKDKAKAKATSVQTSETAKVKGKASKPSMKEKKKDGNAVVSGAKNSTGSVSESEKLSRKLSSDDRRRSGSAKTDEATNASVAVTSQLEEAADDDNEEISTSVSGGSTGADDLLNLALNSLNPGESEQTLLTPEEKQSFSSLPVKEGWKASYREKVEKALADKGLVQVLRISDEGNAVFSNAVEDVQDTTSESEDGTAEKNINQDDESEEDYQDDGDAAIESVDIQDSAEVEEAVEKFNTRKQDDRSSKIPGTIQARVLLEAIEDRSAESELLQPEDEKSLRVGIIGAPNAGKSSLLNYMVGTKVSAVSRKTNTTRSEILGILTENDTQLLFYDTPGLMVGWKNQKVRRDMSARVQSAWMITGHCEVLVVLVDAHREIERPDMRVRRLVEKLGQKQDPRQKRVLCLNKVDLIRQKRELVPLAQEYGSLPGFDRVFMISGLRGSGVRHLKEYLMEEAVLRPWEEQKGVVTDMSPIMIAKDVVWEHVLDNVHQEIPYHLHHKHISWKILNDRSIRIEQQLLVLTENQKKILVGKNGALIRKIGMAANAELSSRFGAKVHLILSVKVARNNLYAAVEDVSEELWL